VTSNSNGQQQSLTGAVPLISVVIPCFNEEAVIENTHRRLVQVLRTCDDIDFELIYVDDCSDDLTLAKLKELQAVEVCVRVLSLSRNFGQHVAVTAGLENSVGDAAVIIDADLQDSPEVILEMVQRWRNGVDVAYGVRREREGETRFKLWTAKAFYRVFNQLSDVPVPPDTGYFRLMDRRVVDAFLSMPERDRFVHGLVSWVGFRQEPVMYRRERRSAGTTKYSLSKMLGVALNGIVSFSMIPLRLAAWLGLAAFSLAILGIFYALVLRLATQIWVPGWTLLFIAVLFLGGTQLIFLGVIGEYVGRIYGEVKRRPLYFVKERLGFPTADVRTKASESHRVLP
jgi:polyisoprenyl-phosphate glycosyltransferase